MTIEDGGIPMDPHDYRLSEVVADCEDIVAHPSCRSCGYFDGTHSHLCPEVPA